MKAVLTIIGTTEPENNWEAAKKAMVNSKAFKQTLLDKKSIGEKTLKKVTKITKAEDFSSTKAPKAAAVLTKWVIALVGQGKQVTKVE